ncbi:MAG TPA: flagellar export chaperone FliS [Phycisphaerae bacterium]|nr:flagellar export chaperone FliS [Phycisphaerae bacterium]
MSGISEYQQNAIATQSRGRLIVLLYDGAIKFCRQAIAELEKGDWAAKGKFINRVIDIVNELDGCLDSEAGGEIATNLRSLYAFIRRHLAEANAKRDPQRISEVIKILEELNEGWKAITA